MAEEKLSPIEELNQYVLSHIERGACTCGRCPDGPENPEDKQPQGHTVNLTFFKVSLKGDPKPEEFKALVEKVVPNVFDGEEHNYMNLGGELGDQGAALILIGMGKLLGVWEALTPDTIMSFLPQETKMKMAGQGMVSLKAKKEEVSV